MRVAGGSTRRRVLVALGIVATALVIAVVLGATRVFGGAPSPRRDVSRYITSVDDIQQRMRPQFAALQLAYRDFSVQQTTPVASRRLGVAERTLRALGRRLAAIPAPADALRLRTLLLELVRDEVSIAHELHTFAGFLPRFRAVVAAVATASAKLGRAFSAAAPPKPHTVNGTPAQIAAAKAAYAAEATRAADAQAAALAAYDRTLEGAVRRLRGLDPPAVLAPAYRSELGTLEATATAGGRLAAELRKQNRSRVPELSLALTRATRLSSTVSAQRFEIAAIRTYDARVRGIRRLDVRIQKTVASLQRSLG